ncbi:MAG: AIR synthase family protein [candidate division WOR-3 bacterium]|nr:AIR synthase family protein [candidate division WOR-3 bacterium]
MLPKIGKIDKEVFEKIIFPNLGKSNERVIVKPRHGVDAGVIEIDEERVMVVACDPTFGMPVLMPFFGWAIVHICASDVAVLGVKPEYMIISLLLPPETEIKTLENIWQQVSLECEKLEIAIVGGHTGVYPGISYPLNGGCTVFGFGKKKELTPASNAKIGDKIVITKGPAIEAAGILAYQGEEKLKKVIDEKLLKRAKNLIWEMTVVKDALIARKYANAMHDATEGGLLNGIYEIAEASKVGAIVYEEKIPILEEVKVICEYFKIDPLISISEGTLIITVPKERIESLIKELQDNGISAFEVGEIIEKERIFIRKNGKKEKLLPIKEDPFWNAYFNIL